MPLLGSSNSNMQPQPLRSTRSTHHSTHIIPSSRNFVRPQARHPLNRPGTLWLDENPKENIPPRSPAPLSPKPHPEPDRHSPLPPRTALGNVTNSSVRTGVPVAPERSNAAADSGIPRSRSELRDLADFLKSTGPEDFTRRNPRFDTPALGGSMVFVDVPINEDKSTSNVLVDTVNKESLAHRKKNTGRWLKKAVGMLWGGPHKAEFNEEPAAKEDVKPPAPTAVLKSPEPPMQNTFIGRTPLAVFGRNAVTRPLNSPDLELSVSESPLVFSDAPRLPPLSDATLSPGGTQRPVAISSLRDLTDTLLCMSAEAAARSRSLRRSNSEESFSDILPAVDATGTINFGIRRRVEEGRGSEVDSVSVYSTDSGVVLAEEAEDEKRVVDSLVFDKDHLPTGLLLNVETPAASSLPGTPVEVFTPKPADPTSTSIPIPDIQLPDEGYQAPLCPLDDEANNSDSEVGALPSYATSQRRKARTSVASICKETGKQHFFVESMGLFFPMPPTYTSPKIEYDNSPAPERDISTLAHDLTMAENEKRFVTLFEEADDVLREIRIEDAEDGFGEYFAANLDSSWATTSSVINTNPTRLSRSFNSSSSLATPGVSSTHTTSMSSDGLLPDENDFGTACWSHPLGGGTRIRIVPATPSPTLGGFGAGVLRKPKSPSRFRSLSTPLEREEGLTDVRRNGLRIGSV